MAQGSGPGLPLDRERAEQLFDRFVLGDPLTPAHLSERACACFRFCECVGAYVRGRGCVGARVGARAPSVRCVEPALKPIAHQRKSHLSAAATVDQSSLVTMNFEQH